MKLTKFLLALLIIVPFVYSCQDDITELTDPRDAICKKYRATDVANSLDFDVEIIKDVNDESNQKVFIDNFHALYTSTGQIATDHMFTAVLAAGTERSVLTLDNKTIDGYTLVSGSGTIFSNNIESFTIEYVMQEGADPAKTYSVDFGPHQINPAKKKTRALTLIPIQ